MDKQTETNTHKTHTHTHTHMRALHPSISLTIDADPMIGVEFFLIAAAIFPALEFGSWMPSSVSVVMHLKRNTKEHDQMEDLASVPSACISTAERVSMIFWRPN